MSVAGDLFEELGQVDLGFIGTDGSHGVLRDWSATSLADYLPNRRRRRKGSSGSIRERYQGAM